MGWNSATPIIEAVHRALFPQEESDESEVYNALSEVWDALKDGDWDVEDEFMEGVELYHQNELPPVLTKLFTDKGYTRMRDRKNGRISWFATDYLDDYSVKDYEIV